jgi:hypothetical protein
MHISKLAPLTRAFSQKTLHALLHVLTLLSPAKALSKILHGDFKNTVCIDMTLCSQRRGSIYFVTLGCSPFLHLTLLAKMRFYDNGQRNDECSQTLFSPLHDDC